jgi:hypothetical protein
MSARESRTGLASLAASGVAVLLAAQGALAQVEPRVRAQIDYVSGSTLYVTAGTADGIVPGDTLAVARDSLGPAIGALHVVAATTDRSSLAFAGAPFALTRGEIVFLEHRVEAEPGPAPEVALQEPRPTAPRAARADGPNANGRISFDVWSLRSTTDPGDATLATTRTFTTPTFRLRLNVFDLPGGLEFVTNLRASYRHDDAGLVDPAGSLRVYQASLVARPAGGRARIELGRFYNPYQSYGGYWDGALVRVGNDRIGVGAAVGFEPDRESEIPSGDVPKGSAFLDWEARGERLGYDGSVSYQVERPKNDLPDRTYIGFEQGLRIGAGRLSQDVELDRTEAGDWTLARLRLSAVAPLGPTAWLNLHYGRSRPDLFRLIADALARRRDGLGGGFSWVGRSLALSGDVTANRVEDEETSWTWTGGVSAPRAGLSIGGSLWRRGQDEVLSLYPAATRRMGAFRGRAGYSLYRSSGLGPTITTHAAEVGLSGPLAPGVEASVRVRQQFGAGLTSTQVNSGIWISF